MGLKTALAASIKGKVAAVALAATLATGTAGGAVVAANQGAFGQQVKAQVASCKAHLAQGVHGIGECVSDFAQRHGAQERQQHSQGNPGTHGNSGTHGPGHGKGTGSGKP